MGDFKAILSIDDRDDKLTAYCLVTATYTIEQYCKRQLLKTQHTEYLDFRGDPVFPLKEYPVRKILSVSHKVNRYQDTSYQLAPKNYYCLADENIVDDSVYLLEIGPSVELARGERTVRVTYTAGYETGEVPADLASACLELADWTMTRYRSRRIGVLGKKGEQLEIAMPENVKGLLEPYRRRTI
jgi:uncharacterized phiE125 gp8 family phage protein